VSARTLRYGARSALLRRGRLYLAYSWLKEPDRTLGRDTEIVIEGARRCANTFAVTAFELAQPRPVCVAHHRHAAVQVVEGARRRLPVLVLVRAPDDAVVSQVLYELGRMSLRRALEDYVRFYDAVLPVLDRVVVATFEQVTTDFGVVVRAVNERFGTDFVPFDHSDDTVRACLERIEQRHVRRLGRTVEEKIARPSPERAGRAEALRSAYRSEPPELRRHADALCAQLSAVACG
jgi:hypothetical protein